MKPQNRLACSEAVLSGDLFSGFTVETPTQLEAGVAMDNNRRKFSKLLCGSTMLGTALSTRRAIAAPLDPDSPNAKSLKFTLKSENENTVCSGCLFYSNVDDNNGRCIIFNNSEVPAVGWCTSFQAKK